MRTICYAPGPLQMPDLDGLDIKANALISADVEETPAEIEVANGPANGHANGHTNTPAANPDVIDEKLAVPQNELVPEADDEAVDGPVVAFSPPLVAAAA